MNKREGYLEEKLSTELVLEPEDMTKSQWKFLKEIFGFSKNENVVNITLPEKTIIKSFIDNE
jgi:hypothetical protein